VQSHVLGVLRVVIAFAQVSADLLYSFSALRFHMAACVMNEACGGTSRPTSFVHFFLICRFCSGSSMKDHHPTTDFIEMALATLYLLGLRVVELRCPYFSKLAIVIWHWQWSDFFKIVLVLPAASEESW